MAVEDTRALAAREGIKAPDGETAEVPAQLETS